VFTDRAEAEAFARQQNKTIRGQRKASSDDELRAWLKSKTRPELQAAVDLVRKQGWGEWQFPSDIDKWTAIMLGAVAGGLDVIERRRAA
jgi:streptogramin lyase